MIHIQDNIRYYYDNITVPIHRNSLKLNPTFTLSNTQEEDGNYYILIFNRHQLLDLIKEYKNHSLRFTYKYSGKGNLAWMLDHLAEFNGNKVKLIYDYSHSRQRILEKRFYNVHFSLLKKESYDPSEMLKTIYYYRQGQVYYVEKFSPSGELISSIYYHENGLVVK